MNFRSWKQYVRLVAIGLISTAIISCGSTQTISEPEKQAIIEQLYSKLAQEFPEIREISPTQLQKMQQEQELVLVDVRPAKERAVSIIPGAIALEKFEQNIKQYQKLPIIFYCTIGYRSGKYAQQISQKHNLDVYNLKGSLLAWSHVRGELINNSGETNKIHVYSPKWKLAAENYQQVW